MKRIQPLPVCTGFFICIRNSLDRPCIQDLLLELESKCLGFQLGDIYIGTPTCADDIALIESNKENLQIMINVIGRYAKQHHYRIHPMKTKIIQYSTTNIHGI